MSEIYRVGDQQVAELYVPVIPDGQTVDPAIVDGFREAFDLVRQAGAITSEPGDDIGRFESPAAMLKGLGPSVSSRYVFSGGLDRMQLLVTAHFKFMTINSKATSIGLDPGSPVVRSIQAAASANAFTLGCLLGYGAQQQDDIMIRLYRIKPVEMMVTGRSDPVDPVASLRVLAEHLKPNGWPAGGGNIVTGQKALLTEADGRAGSITKRNDVLYIDLLAVPSGSALLMRVANVSDHTVSIAKLSAGYERHGISKALRLDLPTASLAPHQKIEFEIPSQIAPGPFSLSLFDVPKTFSPSGDVASVETFAFTGTYTSYSETHGWAYWYSLRFNGSDKAWYLGDQKLP